MATFSRAFAFCMHFNIVLFIFTCIFSSALNSEISSPRSIQSKHQNERKTPIIPYETSDNEKNFKDEDVSRKLKELDRVLNNSVNKGSLGIKMKEETKRVARQVRKQRPGFFWTLARVAFETFNDTTSAVKQISQLIAGSIAPEPKKQRTKSNVKAKENAGQSLISTEKSIEENGASTTAMPVTKKPTSKPFILTRNVLLQLISRNLRGLIRLFNIEWRDALNQSMITAREFRQSLGKQVQSYLQDNPDLY